MVKNVQLSPLRVSVMGACLAYMFVFLSFQFIIYPAIEADHHANSITQTALKHAALHGFIIYGIFNATNITIFKNYSKQMALLDTLWGATAYFISVSIVLHMMGIPRRNLITR
jgi:uncharacterized membrane protein